MAQAIANRYASALAEVVTKPGSPVTPEAALEQLETFLGLFESSPELVEVLASPAVLPDAKRRLIAGLVERCGISGVVRNFLYVVTDQRRMRLLGEMRQAFRDWLDERQGIARLHVRSATAMDEIQRLAMIQRFAQLTGKRIEADFSQDPALLGGAVVRHGSMRYDGSLKRQLEALRGAVTHGA